MSRYIDADALAYLIVNNGDADFINKVTKLMIDAPSIDIVRCKECKHRHKTDRGITYCDCITYGFNHTEDDFCSHGEREDK